MKTQIYQTTNEKMEKTISVLKEDLKTIKTAIVEQILRCLIK